MADDHSLPPRKPSTVSEVLARYGLGAPEPTPAPPQPETHGDRAVAGIFDLLGLLFGLPFGDDLYKGTPILAIPWFHWIYLAIGIACAGFGHMWPVIKVRAPVMVQQGIPSLARNPLAWLAIALAMFFYGVGPEMYRRATEPPVSLPSSLARQQPPAEPIKELAPDSAPISGLELGGELQDLRVKINELTQQNAALRQKLAAQQEAAAAVAPTGGPINWLGRIFIYNAPGKPGQIGLVDFRGTVVGSSPVQLKEAYLLSELTGEKRSFVINTRVGFQDAEKLSLDQINPLPPGASVELMIQWQPPLSILDFYNKWGKVSLIIEYDNTNYQRLIDEDTMKSYIVSDIVGADLVLGVPRVTKKQ